MITIAPAGLIFYYFAMWSRWTCIKIKMLYVSDNQSSDKQSSDMRGPTVSLVMIGNKIFV